MSMADTSQKHTSLSGRGGGGQTVPERGGTRRFSPWCCRRLLGSLGDPWSTNLGLGPAPPPGGLSLMTDRACLCASSLLATFSESLDAGGTWPCSGWWLSSSPCWCSGRAGCPRRWSSLVFSASPAGWPRGPQAFPRVLPKLCPESAAPEDTMSQTTALLGTLRCPASVPKHSGGARRCFL